MNLIKAINEAKNFQDKVRVDEKKQREAGLDYDEQYVRQSIVHTREDLILIIASLSLLDHYMKRANTLLTIIAILFIVLILIILVKY